MPLTTARQSSCEYLHNDEAVILDSELTTDSLARYRNLFIYLQFFFFSFIDIVKTNLRIYFLTIY